MLKQPVSKSEVSESQSYTRKGGWERVDTLDGSISYTICDNNYTAVYIFDIDTIRVIDSDTFDINCYFMRHNREAKASTSFDMVIRLHCGRLELQMMFDIKQLSCGTIIQTPHDETFHKFNDGDLFADLCISTGEMRAKFK